MTARDDLVPVLKKLRLSGILETLDLRTRQAVEDNLAHSEFVYRLLTDEVERREGKQLALRFARAQFEHEKTLEDFDFSFNPKIPKAKILDLATCRFIDRQEVILLVGFTGTGKSHLAQAIGHRACRAGYSVLFVAARQLFQQLRAARADGTYERRLLRLTSPALLIVDDLGLRPLRDEEPGDLYEIIRQRHERGATIVTSNRAIAEWYPLFLDPLLASAAMDRLLEYAHIIELEGDSYRNPERRRKAASSEPRADAPRDRAPEADPKPGRRGRAA